MIRIGIIGKTNTGKTTFFNAATSGIGEVSTYPFTTKKPNTATGQVQTLCVCRELGVTDNQKTPPALTGGDSYQPKSSTFLDSSKERLKGKVWERNS